MRQVKKKITELRRYRYAALSVGGLVVVGGLLLVLWGANQEGDVSQILLVNAGAVFMTVGGVGVIYESRLRPSLIADILDASDLAEAKIESVVPVSELRVSGRQPAQREVLVVVPKLITWMEQADWNSLLRHSAQVPTQIRIYTGGLDETDAELASARIRSDWDNAISTFGSPKSRGSAVVVFVHPSSTPSMYIYRSGDSGWVAFDEPFGTFREGRALAIQYKQSKSPLGDWTQDVESRFASSCSQLTVCGSEDAVRAIVHGVPQDEDERSILR